MTTQTNNLQATGDKVYEYIKWFNTTYNSPLTQNNLMCLVHPQLGDIKQHVTMVGVYIVLASLVESSRIIKKVNNMTAYYGINQEAFDGFECENE